MKKVNRPVGIASLLLVLVAIAVPSLRGQGKPQRINSMITTLEEQGSEPVFARDTYTFYDMEHPPFDVAMLRKTLSAWKLASDKPVLVRIPAYGWELETNQWQVKQVLDQGAHGVIFPHIETPEQALVAIRAMRYRQRPGVPDFEPAGRRGHFVAIAAPVWGLDQATYTARADIWKLDPAGELIPILLIESREGVANVHAIARAMKNLNVGVVIWAGTGDMAVDYCGVPNCEIDGKVMPEMALLERGVRTVLAAGKEFGVPVQMNSPVVHDPSTGQPVQQDTAAHIKQRMEQGARLF